MKNNKTGAQGADGVEDTDAPLSDCDSAFDGPGTNYTCVNFAPPGGSSLAYCLQNQLRVCGADSDCPEGEGCMLTGIGGSPNCALLHQEGPGRLGRDRRPGRRLQQQPVRG